MSDNDFNTEDQKAFAALRDMMKPEDLHPDLVPYLTESAAGIPILNHPLVQNLFHSAAFNRQMNLRYEEKKKALEESIQNRNYIRTIYLHERPFRLDAFIKYIFTHVTGKEYWELLQSVWIDTMNSWQSHELWEVLWENKTPGREFCMEETERAVLVSLPEKIVAYRGTGNNKNQHGFSWSLDIEVAKKFSRMYGQKGDVYRAVIPKENIYAYFNGRNEAELVVKPKTFKMRKIKGG